MPMALRILQILRSPVGGLFRHVGDLTRELSARGHQIGILVDSLSADSLTAARLEGLRPFAALGIHMSPMPRVLGLGDVTTTLKARQLAKTLNIDVLHGHGAKGGLYARMARGKRVALYTPHGGVLHFSPRSPSGLAFTTIERWLQSRTDAFIFESAFAKRTYAEKIVPPLSRVAVIHNGLDENEFVPVAPNADAADFVFVGELRKLKGIFTLIEALAGLTGPGGRPATLVMAGDGAERGELEAHIARLGFGARVTLAGAQPARAMFARGRCAVVPSLAESLPYIVMEASAAGLPVIATNVGGIPEIFGPVAERLVPPDDAAALRTAMQRFLSEPDVMRREAATMLAHVRTSFSAAHMVDQVEALYRELLA
jgi:glycosyltransferase involved in cell wall biosynthesis